jgi:hypothetical protein
MNVDEIGLKILKMEVEYVLNHDDISKFNKLLNSRLTPLYLFYDHYHSSHIEYKNYSSIFTKICEIGKLNFVKNTIENYYFKKKFKL